MGWDGMNLDESEANSLVKRSTNSLTGLRWPGEERCENANLLSNSL